MNASRDICTPRTHSPTSPQFDFRYLESGNIFVANQFDIFAKSIAGESYDLAEMELLEVFDSVLLVRLENEY